MLRTRIKFHADANFETMLLVNALYILSVGGKCDNAVINVVDLLPNRSCSLLWLLW